MKFHFSTIILVVSLLMPFGLSAQIKDTSTYYKYINQDRGTVVFKEIKRNNFISKDSAIMILRLYGLNCTTVKGGPNAAKSIIIDGLHYSSNSEGILQLMVAKGNHLLDLEYPGDSLFSPLKETTLKLKKRHIYSFEVYFSIPVKGYHSL